MKTATLSSLSLLFASSLAVRAQNDPAPAALPGDGTPEVTATVIEETTQDTNTDSATIEATSEDASGDSSDASVENSTDSPEEETAEAGGAGGRENESSIVIDEATKAATDAQPAEGADVSSTSTSTSTSSSSAVGASPADVKTTKTSSITTRKLPGGKLLLTSGPGDKRAIQVFDVASKESADAPIEFNFDAKMRIPGSGPVTFMGVSVSPASEELSIHLPLAKGTGLIVQSVSKDSPAQKAGILENDILTKLDDQILIHPTQFSVLVSSKKEGDSVKLSLLRKGAVQEIPVVLGKNEGGDAGGGAGMLKFGDVEVQVGGAGADSKPLRTYIKRWAVDSNSPQAKELKLGGGGGLEFGGQSFKIEGDKLKVESDKLKTLNDALKDKSDKMRETVQKQIDEAMRRQKHVMEKFAAQAKQSDQAQAAAGAADDKAGKSADQTLSDEAKQKAIHDLEETLRKLKSE